MCVEQVTMADCTGCLHPPMFSWNAGMVMHIVKGDPTLRDLEHIQVDGPGTAYLFFCDKQGHRGFTLDATQTLRTHVGEAFTELISHSVHFAVILLLLEEGWCQAVAVSEWHHQRSRAEYQGHPMMNLLPVSQTPPCNWLVVPSLPWHR